MMGEFMRNWNVWIAIAVWGSFWLFAPFMDPHDVFVLVNGLAVSLGIGVLVAYGPGGWRSINIPKRIMAAGNYLVLGVIVVCAAVTARLAYQAAWRWMGEPQWMADHLFAAWLVWVIASGYAVHLSSIGAIEGRIPTRNLVKLGFFVAAGLAVALVVAIFFDPR